MGKSSSKSTKVLPVIPLGVPLALLPGTTLKIPITNRADVAAILAKIYSVSATAKPDAAITIACVPLNSPQLSKNGRLMIEEGKEGGKQQVFETDPMLATEKDLFGYGCVAKVSGVQGRQAGDLSLLVEGLERVVVESVIQERPYFEAVVGSLVDEGMSAFFMVPEYVISILTSFQVILLAKNSQNSLCSSNNYPESSSLLHVFQPCFRMHLPLPSPRS